MIFYFVKENGKVLPAVSKFIHPYLEFVGGAAFSLGHALQDLGVPKSEFLQTHLSGFVPRAITLLWVLLLLMPLIIGAAYTLGRFKGGVIALCVLLAPGVLNLMGFFPDLRYGAPNSSMEGVGVIGNVMALIPLLMMVTAAGWSITVLLYDTLNLTDKFHHYYDHFWFLTALTAAVFFVTDSTASNSAQNLSNASRVAQDSSRYLLLQIRRYQDYCRINGLEFAKSCQWSNYSQWTIGSLAEYGPVLFEDFAPESSRGFFQQPREANLSDEDILTIRRELLEYNQKVCPVKQLSKDAAQYAPLSDSCESPPFEYCSAWPDGPVGFVDPYISQRPVAIANECIIPNLVRLKSRMPGLLADDREASQVKNYRWFYFLFIALAVGGKIANSSTKLVDFKKRSRAIFVKDLWRLTIFLASFVWKAFRSGLSFTCYTVKAAIAKFKALRPSA
ncbi:hypothetical protein ALP45_03912 [Pseudomonas coronafaciens pv. atropurpurea]|uniref:hypothetical protein n=1 Tax=Pseudomonas coronafaciens TaxID=53409 RepID=UPI0006D63925|nr:hypothetical protein [Pseudomonas coronafaciens]KPW28816.1 hypothetical protein ALO66_01848 [Pseudomonas coronafaciens pv. atropurpurea]RMT53109.1 hypothetical protein ALP45_03912 [Pseudomonas coronafaciens pv. atropurpurea]